MEAADNVHIISIQRSGDQIHEKKSKVVPLHAMDVDGGRGGFAPTHS
jgi:hypothetical protein